MRVCRLPPLFCCLIPSLCSARLACFVLLLRSWQMACRAFPYLDSLGPDSSGEQLMFNCQNSPLHASIRPPYAFPPSLPRCLPSRKSTRACVSPSLLVRLIPRMTQLAKLPHTHQTHFSAVLDPSLFCLHVVWALFHASLILPDIAILLRSLHHLPFPSLPLRIPLHSFTSSLSLGRFYDLLLQCFIYQSLSCQQQFPISKPVDGWYQSMT